MAEKLSPSAMARLEAAGEVEVLSACDEATLMSAVGQADALAVRTYSEVTARVITEAGKAGRLKVIGRAGVGVDNIDVKAAAEAGIPVVHTPAACTIAVAELVVGLIVAVQRRIVSFDGRIRQGEFASLRSEGRLMPELRGQTLGVIGMGRIGRAVSQRMRNGLGMRIIYHDIREIGYLPFAATSMPSHEAVYAEADVVTMHVPLTRLTRGMIDAGVLSRFKEGSVLINTSRGPVVQARALADALGSGRLSGAAIDVFDPEPPPPDHPLLSAPNCVLTPHVASRSKEGLAAMNDVVDDIVAVLQGKAPQYVADPELC
ncbi:MAG TPA: NAD(P)-dependent oxidoreductase [Phycisphaerae bacterium]|nr:NAD(P)-dependent oxidoreductase [Phycisphaerae bacterium]